MSITLQPSPENQTALANYAREINDTHLLTVTNAGMALVFAVRTGILCLQAKALCPHGTFAWWLKANCPAISERTAQNYMRIMGDAKYESVADLHSDELLAPEFSARIRDDSAYRDTLTDRVRNVVGASSIMRLYESAGVIPASTPTPSTSDPKGTRGLYTPHAVRLVFDRTLRQTTKRVPQAEWTAPMREAWVNELQPIADLVAELSNHL